MMYPIAYWVVWAMSKMYFPITLQGTEFLPKDPGYIIACNHQSNLDPVLIGYLARKRLNFVAKDSLFKNKFLGWLIADLGAFPIRRNSADIRSLREALRRLKGGEALVLFPQGTRKALLDEESSQQGVGFIAAKSGRPVVPAYIDGTDKVMPPGAKGFQRALVTVRYGPPISFAGEQDFQDIARRIMKAIRDLQPSGKDPVGE